MPAQQSPVELLQQERQLAAAQGDPWSGLCALASINNQTGMAQVRTLVLRDINSKLAIFINATSPKWAELRSCGKTQFMIYLASISVQYRLDASLEPIPKHIVDESWLLRPDIPKSMDWYYTEIQAQSSTVESRAALKSRFDEHNKNGNAECAPETAVGLYLNLERIERLELLKEEIHARNVWQWNSTRWLEQTLVP